MSLIKRINEILPNILKNRGGSKKNCSLWVPPGQFNSPIPNIEEVLQRESELFNSNSKIIQGINLREEYQISLLKKILKYFPEFESMYLNTTSDELRFTLNEKDNYFFSYVDALVLWGMIMHWQPSNIIEIGSGYSSALMLDMNEYISSLQMNLTFIEPFPERLLSLLQENDKKKSTIIGIPVQDIPMDIFTSLTENDFIFIDSSHVSKTGSDVNHILFSILPYLKKGVLIHFHDIFFPFEYKKDWVLEGRAWNEAYICKAFLMYNPNFEVVLFNSFLEHFHSNIFEKPYEYFPQKDGASLWIRKKC